MEKRGSGILLPLNPTSPEYGNSPYSSISAFAGNSLLISPDFLIKKGLIAEEDIQEKPTFEQTRCDYSKVIFFKERLLQKAYEHFKSKRKTPKSYERFCEQNSCWLGDYSLFVVVKNRFGGKVWSQWPKELRDRRKRDLDTVKKL